MKCTACLTGVGAGDGVGSPVFCQLLCTHEILFVGTVYSLDAGLLDPPFTESRERFDGSTVNSRCLCCWHLLSASRKRLACSSSSCRSDWTSSVSAASFMSLSGLIPLTFVGAKMLGMSETRQLSTARLMTLSMKVLRAICSSQHINVTLSNTVR